MVRVPAVTHAVANTGCGVQRRHVRTTYRNRWKSRLVLPRGALRLVGGAGANRRLHGGNIGIGAARDEQPHRIDVSGVGRTPECGGPRLVDARSIEVVAGVPRLLVDTRVRVGTF